MNRPTRSPETEKAYLKRAGELIVLFRRATGLDWKANPNSLITWLSNKKSTFAKRSYRYNKSSLVYHFQAHGMEEAAQALEHIGSDGCKKSSDKTSASKKKCISIEELEKLTNKLTEKPNNEIHKTTIRWLTCSILVGLRPIEWANATLIDRDLIIQNAKATNGRACGDERIQHLDKFPNNYLTLIRELCDEITPENHLRKYEQSRQCLYRVCRQLWPRRKKHITLSTARHQFAANMKRAGDTCIEAAAKLGHASDATAGRHYSKRRSGWANAPQVLPSVQNMGKVKITGRSTFSPIAGPTPTK